MCRQGPHLTLKKAASGLRNQTIHVQLNANICVSKQSLFAVEQTMEDKEAIVFDDAFIRKAFKGSISFDELLLYLCKLVVQNFTLVY